MSDKPSEQVRAYCLDIARHARAEKKHGFMILAGDVHSALDFSNRLPAVTSVLGSDGFEREARVKRIAVDGPTNGANALFVYRVK